METGTGTGTDGRWLRRGGLIIALLGAATVLLPIGWMISTSLKPETEVFRQPIEWLPVHVRPDNYAEATTLIPFWLYFANSLLIVVPVVIGTVLSSAAVAYAFARMRAPGMSALFALVLAGIMLPGEVTLVPSYLLFKELGWIGTYLPLTVPAWLGGGAFNIFLLRQAFLTIPPEHDDVARVDGHGFLTILLRVVIPQSWPAISLVAVFAFVDTWNDFLGPLLYVTDQQRYTLPLGLNFFKDIYNTQWAHLMAASVLALVPCVVVFFLAQRVFTQGIVLTGRR
ncbi:MAG: carbohydrate ABC transporter permease [Chloroflexi bacterium]|nr:carbohydrate ABC transporter permease [Chloroflexota bacterium]